MRRGNGGSIGVDANGDLKYVSLGADYCAEHEWGVKGIKLKLGITEEVTKENAGAGRRSVTKRPDLTCAKYGLDYVIASRSKYVDDSAPEYHDWLDRTLSKPYQDDGSVNVVGAWDESSFGVRFLGGPCRHAEKHRDQLLRAFDSLDVVMWIGGGGVFKNGGLCFGVKSKMESEIFAQWTQVDLDAMELQKASDQTGIIERLKKAERGYHACLPRWCRDDEKKLTKHSVIYWLNPREQQANNFGWFTVEDLDMWIDGVGPCVKKRQ